MSWCIVLRRKIPPISEVANIKDRVKPDTEDASPLLYPCKPGHLLDPLRASFTSSCPVSSFVRTCSNVYGSASSALLCKSRNAHGRNLYNSVGHLPSDKRADHPRNYQLSAHLMALPHFGYCWRTLEGREIPTSREDLSDVIDQMATPPA